MFILVTEVDEVDGDIYNLSTADAKHLLFWGGIQASLDWQ